MLYKEKPIEAYNGIKVFVFNCILLGFNLLVFVAALYFEIYAALALPGVGVLVNLYIAVGFFELEPNYCMLCTFCGKYMGTIRTQGYWWFKPWYSKKYISLRLINFETGRVKCNDAIGNPI